MGHPGLKRVPKPKLRLNASSCLLGIHSRNSGDGAYYLHEINGRLSGFRPCLCLQKCVNAMDNTYMYGISSTFPIFLERPLSFHLWSRLIYRATSGRYRNDTVAMSGGLTAVEKRSDVLRPTFYTTWELL